MSTTRKTDAHVQYYCREIARLALAPATSIENVKPQHCAAVERSSIGDALRVLAKACDSAGIQISKGYILSLAFRFFSVNGMMRRFPAPWDVTHGQGRKERTLTVEVEYLRSLWLWVPVHLSADQGREGRNSLHSVSKLDLEEIATSFFRTGLRCAWFEKMIIQSLVSAEAYAFREHIKSDGTLVSGRPALLRNLLIAWAYEASNGASPRYEIYLWLVRVVDGLIKLGVIGALAVYGTWLVDNEKPIRGYIAGAIAAWMAINVIGKFVTGRIVQWIRAPSGDLLSTIRGNPTLKLLEDGMRVHEQVSHSNMNPALARHLLTDCASRGFLVDAIVFSYLDRAVAANEHRWPSQYELPAGFDHYDEVEDSTERIGYVNETSGD